MLSSICSNNQDVVSLVPSSTNDYSDLCNLTKQVIANVTGSKPHSLQAVELSQRTQAAIQIVSNRPAPSNGGPIYRFWGMRTRWMAGAAAHKSG